jgi:peroxiredoxin
MARGLVVSSLLLWIVVLFNLLMTLALIRHRNAAPPTPGREVLKVGQSAPGFTAETLNGEEVTLSTYAGRAVAFLFIGTHCSPCRTAIPTYEALRPKAMRAGVELILVSIDDVARTQAFAEELHVTLPVLVAPHTSNPFMDDYKGTGTPFYCLVDAQSKVQSTGYPSPDWGEWKTLSESWADEEIHEARFVLAGGR